MEIKELKKLASDSGLEFARNATTKQIMELLDAAEIPYSSNPIVRDIEVEEIVKTNSYDTNDHDFQELMREYKLAESAADVKRADQKRFILKEKIKSNKSKMLKFLQWEKQRKLITVSDDYILNELEKETCTKTCECIRRLPSGGHFADVASEYSYKDYFDESRGKQMYVIYIERTIPPEDQIDKKLAWKMSQGFMPTENDYTNEKVQIRKTVLVESEFNKYFKVDELV